MRQTKFALALITAVTILSGCGSGSGTTPGNQTLRFQYTSQVSFGDSLSDVGTYAVGTVAALGGGKWTINGDNRSVNPALTGLNWTELLAAQIGLPAPCPAQTGLDGSAALGFSVPVVNHPGCYGYAQGGARVTNPVGAGHKLTGSPLGALTVPVVQQVQNHLAAVGGRFKNTDLVLVMAGGNDILVGLAQLSAGATTAGSQAFATTLAGLLAQGATNPATAAQAIGAAIATESARAGSTSTTIVSAAVTAAATQPGNAAVASPSVYGPYVTQAQTAGTNAGNAYAAANGPALVQALATAGSELVNIVKTQIVAKGATRVVVNNLPDVGTTPSGRAQSPEIVTLINTAVKAFNDTLAAGLSTDPNVLLVDVFTVSHDQATNPGPYGLTNVSDTACDLNPARNATSSALTCNASNLIAGDVSHYSFADGVHPTPFTYLLLARFVSERMVVRGWL